MSSELSPYPLVFAADSPLRPIYRTLEKVLDADATVLIEGESGTGKDALAQWLHGRSSRRAAPLIKIDLGALPEDLVESELFGYERGAFTGAEHAKLGKFDLAQGGSVVLDEIANVDMRIQAKLLEVVEAKRFTRLGGNRPIDLDCRIIALSAMPLAEAVKQQTFRQDLFFRLNLITVRIPPLRERRGEILAIAQALLALLIKKYNIAARLDPACQDVFMRYGFPGNLRELRNGLERALLMSPGGEITPDRFPPSWTSVLAVQPGGSLPSLEAVEREHIEKVLRHHRGRKAEAAAILGISRKTLLEKRKKYGLE